MLVLRDGWAWQPQASSRGREPAASPLTPRQLEAFCRSLGLAGFKLPRVWAAWSQLPTTSSGKVKKQVVRELLQQQAGVCARL